MNPLMSAAATISSAAQNPMTDTLSANGQLIEHRYALEALHADAELHDVALAALSGNVASEKTSTIGIGVAKLVITRKDQTYRARDALAAAPDDRSIDGAIWVEVKGNTTLRHLISKYGTDLLAYDAARTEMSLELFAFEVFETHTRTVRILVRQNTQ